MSIETLHFSRVPVRKGDRSATVVDLGLIWDEDRSHEVVLLIGAPAPRAFARPIKWVLARDLLADGLNHPAGHGDVAIFPDLAAADGQGIELVLSSPGGRAALPLPVEPIRVFLDRTYAAVPAGAEQIPWDTTDLAGGLT